MIEGTGKETEWNIPCWGQTVENSVAVLVGSSLSGQTFLFYSFVQGLVDLEMLCGESRVDSLLAFTSLPL